MNHAQGIIKLYLAKDTEMGEEEILKHFHKDNMVGAKLEITLSNGDLHKMDVLEVLEMCWEYFEYDEK
ncbi:hypothetical protein JK635_02155 [Neobacillus sp. YIM B02564]|uniref:Uncharacterized protein n=1 Tax=Neobacillus paridis TaxID=2803862 RepID=A0ABS1TIE7_9BACI|nr:hypothetical protein [Neobacillus paridis]MBL4951042.1 hypothetical protein [Neobacillus paridis]